MGKKSVVPCLELKSHDGAWYEVSLKLENDKVKIHYEADLPESRDEELSLETVNELQELKANFRLPSRQLVDKDCKKVMPGTIVCAFHSDMDKRTFDARVEKVSWSKHIFVDGEEQCNCTFEVLWLAGPYEREKTTIYCENICLLQFKNIRNHPVIKDVVKYLQNKKDYISQFAVENSSKKKIEKTGDISRPLNPRVIDLHSENTEKILNRGDHWPVGDRHLTDIEEELRELNSKPSTLMEMENAEKSFNYKLNMKDNILQELFSNDNKPGNLVQSMIYSIPEKNVLNGTDIDSNLCSPKQENKDTIAAACKSEGDGYEMDSLVRVTFGTGDAKGGCLLKIPSEDFLDGFSGGWIDDESPRLGKDCGGNIIGKSDNEFAYFSVTGDVNHMNGHKEFPEDCSAGLDDSNKSSSLVIIDDEDGDMQSTDEAIECLSSRKEGEIWDVAKNEGIMNACTVYSQGRSREPKVANDELASDNYIQNRGKNIECKRPLDGLTTPCLTPNKRKDLSPDSCDCKDVTCNRKKESGMHVHICMPDSMWDHQGKRRRCDKSQLVKALVEGNIPCEMEEGDPVGKKRELKKQNSEISRSGRFDRNDVFKLYGAPVEANNVIVDNKVGDSTPKSCCGRREYCFENHPSKHIATEDVPPMQCQDAHHSTSGLHDFSTNLLHNDDVCHCHFCNKSCPCCTHFHLHHEYCAECGECICSLVGKAHYCYSQAMCTGLFSVHKEIAANSSDCVGDDNDGLVSLKDKLTTDYKEQSELSHTGNLNVPTYQSLKSSRTLNLDVMAVINNEAKCNRLEQAVGQISIDAGCCGTGIEEEWKDQHKLFPSSHVILLENLEKDVTPSDVLGVIHQAGVDFVKVYISPPQSFQKFTRGIVCFEDQESFQRASAFVQNENIIIASSNGRPWVVIDTENGLSEGSFGGFTTGPKCCGCSSSNKIQILKIGTPEYERAEKLRAKFLEWWEDLKLLHRALAYEETAVQQSIAVSTLM